MPQSYHSNKVHKAIITQQAEANINVENYPSLNLEVAEISIEACSSDKKHAQAKSNVSLESNVMF